MGTFIYKTDEERIEARNRNAKIRREKDPEKFRKAWRKWYSKQDNKDKVKKYHDANKETIALNNKKRRERNLDKVRKANQEWGKKMRTTNPLHRFKCNIRALIYHSFRRKRNYTTKKSKRTEEILGCSIMYFIDYLLSLCPEGITISDFGQYGYHIDHIVPLATANTEEEIIRLCHYTNFQPLWWRDNLKKSSKILEL